MIFIELNEIYGNRDKVIININDIEYISIDDDDRYPVVHMHSGNRIKVDQSMSGVSDLILHAMELYFKRR